MPRLIAVSAATPMNVEAAARVLGSTFRLHLIRYYQARPGSQVDAAEALGVAHSSVGNNLKELISAGVIIEEPADDRRTHIYRVDTRRLSELLAAVTEFTMPPADAGDQTHK